MRVTKRFLLLALAGLLICLDVAAPQAGPKNRPSETVARPKKKSDTSKGAPEAELPKIPSKYNRRDAPSIDVGTRNTQQERFPARIRVQKALIVADIMTVKPPSVSPSLWRRRRKA